MARVLELINGVPRMRDEASPPTIYDESLEVVSSGAGAGQINGPISTGTPITLPSSGSYEADELEIYLNGARLEDAADYNYVGAGPTRTQVSFTFDIVVGDDIRFRVDRSA